MLVGLGGLWPCDRVPCSLSCLLLLPLTRAHDCQFTLRVGTVATNSAVHTAHLQGLQHDSNWHVSKHLCDCEWSTLSHIQPQALCWAGTSRVFLLEQHGALHKRSCMQR